MIIEKLTLRNFRNYTNETCNPPSGLCLVVGANASGKTNLVEAIALVCTGRSLRGHRDIDLVQKGANGYRVELTTVLRNTRMHLDASYETGSIKRIRRDGQVVRRRADLFGQAPVVTFFPDDLRLVKGSPGGRRRFLDLAAAQMEPRHVVDLQEYQRTVEQRNALLRDIRDRRAGHSVAGLFDDQFLDLGLKVVQRRLRILTRLTEAAALIQARVGAEELNLSYLLGGNEPWDDRDSLADMAARKMTDLRDLEFKRGFSLWGPHRDDIGIELNGMEARIFASQGQQRTAVLALKGAEIRLITETLQEPPVVVLDDVLSELDERRSEALGQVLEGIQQTIITAAAVPQSLWSQPRSAALYVSDGQITAGKDSDIGRTHSF